MKVVLEPHLKMLALLELWFKLQVSHVVLIVWLQFKVKGLLVRKTVADYVQNLVRKTVAVKLSLAVGHAVEYSVLAIIIPVGHAVEYS